MRSSLLLAALLAVVLPVGAQAYVRSRVTSNGVAGPELFWCTRSVPFIVNALGSANAGASSLEAVRRSFDAWSAATCSDFTFVDKGTTSRSDIGFDWQRSDNTDLVVWREVGCGEPGVVPFGDPCLQKGGCNNLYNCWEGSSQTIALTTTTFNTKTGEIYDADIEFNGAGYVFTTADAPPCVAVVRGRNDCVATDIQNTLTHEVGHVVGLDHNDLPETTMYPSAVQGETKKRNLSQDDLNGLCDIYPLGSATEGCNRPDVLTGDGCGCGASGGPLAALGGALALLAAWRRKRS